MARPTPKRVLVTGGNTGIGLEASRQLVAAGHDVILACRDPHKAAKAVDALRSAAASTGATMEWVQLDLASLDSVRACAAEVLRRHASLDVVLLNAGVYPADPLSSSGSGLQRTGDGQEANVQVNHLGHFLLVHLLLPALKSAPAARVVTVSSELHKKATGRAGKAPDAPPLADPAWLTRLAAPAAVASAAGTSAATAAATAADAAAPAEPPATPAAATDTAHTAPYEITAEQLYSLTKLYNLWFTSRLAAVLPATVTPVAVTPGWVPATDLGRQAPWLLRLLYKNLCPLLPFAVPLAEGGRRVVAACVGGREGWVRGAYYSRGVQADTSPEAHDEAAAAELWRLSEAAVGITYYVGALQEGAESGSVGGGSGGGDTSAVHA